MSKIRLNSSHREIMLGLVKDLIACPTETAATAKAYATASVLVRKMVEKALPPADMAVLKKYEKASVRDCIGMTLSAGGFVQFWFMKETGPLTTGSRTFVADEKTTIAVNAHIAAKDKSEKALKDKMSDYQSLINNSRYFEDVVAVWPEAEKLRSQFGGQALITLSPDIVARIQQDVAGRMAA